MAYKMAARNKYKRLWYVNRCTDFVYHNSSNLCYLFLKCMLELFNDTFKYGFNFKVNVKFKVKYQKIVKKCLFRNFLLLLYQS